MLYELLTVALGGALGAVTRFLTVRVTYFLVNSDFPVGTLLVNYLGSFLAGFFMVLIMERMQSSELLRLFIVVGFLGGYTTFSSFSWETWMLWSNGQFLAATLNILLNNFGSFILVILGMNMARMIGA